MSLLFNMLSRLVTDFLPRTKHLLISWLKSPSTVILMPKKIKSVALSIVSLSVYHEVMRPDAMILVFWMLSFKPASSLFSFTFIKRLFSSSLLSAIRVIFISEVIHISPGNFDSSLCFIHLAFHMMYSAKKLNKQDNNIQPWCTPFPILNLSIVPCLFLDLPTKFSGGREGDLVFPSLEEFSTVCCDPRSQKLWRSQ